LPDPLPAAPAWDDGGEPPDWPLGPDEVQAAPAHGFTAQAQASGRGWSRQHDAASAATRKPRRGAARGGLLARADHVARIVLATPAAWDWLSADDHQLLAHEPAPHGPLFAWLETQWHEHGPQPWAALREALRGQPFEALALELNAGGLALQRPEDEASDGADAPSAPGQDELQRELRELMRRLHIEALKQRETELIAAVGSDPEALERYRELQALRKALEAGNPDERI
jgi:DNA primase